MLIDVHAHFYTDRCGRSNWQAANERRLSVGDRIGITTHIGSVLGSWGHDSPTYFPSADDVTHGNGFMLELQRAHPGKVFGYCVVNPNYREHALGELERRIGEGMVGIKLLASRRADDPLLDEVAEVAADRSLPLLHHIWQHRRSDRPGQEASDAVELAALAARHPEAKLILAHIGGGGDWSHSLRALTPHPNVWVDLSGSGIDGGMIEMTLRRVGAQRVLWGTDLTMDTGWAKLRYLRRAGLTPAEIDSIASGNARSIFNLGKAPK